MYVCTCTNVHTEFVCPYIFPAVQRCLIEVGETLQVPAEIDTRFVHFYCVCVHACMWGWIGVERGVSKWQLGST